MIYAQTVTRIIRKKSLMWRKFWEGSKRINRPITVLVTYVCLNSPLSNYLYINRIYIIYDNNQKSLDIMETVGMLSPVVLLKEVDNLIKNKGEKYFFISEWYLLSLPFNNNDVIFSGLTLPSPHYHHPLGEKFQPKSF